MPDQTARYFPSDRTCLAAGLLSRLLDAIDQGRFTEASRARAQLASLGIYVAFRRERSIGPIQKGGRS